MTTNDYLLLWAALTLTITLAFMQTSRHQGESLIQWDGKDWWLILVLSSISPLGLLALLFMNGEDIKTCLLKERTLRKEKTKNA